MVSSESPFMKEITKAKKALKEDKGMVHEKFMNELRTQYSEFLVRKRHDHKGDSKKRD